jgi:hypothetical protein
VVRRPSRDRFVGGARRSVQALPRRLRRTPLARVVVAGRDDAFRALQMMARPLALFRATCRRHIRAGADRLGRIWLIGSVIRFGLAPLAVRTDEAFAWHVPGPAFPFSDTHDVAPPARREAFS